MDELHQDQRGLLPVDVSGQPRITPLAVDEFRAVERELGLGPVDEPLNVMTTLAHNPRLYKAWQHFAGTLFTGDVDPRDRELIILRAAWRAGSAYEWGQHAGIARDAGLTPAEIRRVTGGADMAGWSPADAVLLRAVDELVDEGRISDATWSALAGRFDDAKLLHVAMLAGHYVMLAGVLASAGVELESPIKPALGEA